MNRRHALKSFSAAALAAALPARAAPAPDSLDAIARGKGLRVGNAMGYGGSGVRKSPFRDAGYRALMAHECSVIVAENECKWQANEPRPGEFRFAQADEMFAWAKQEGMTIRGHTLVWQTPKWLPKWVNEHDFGAQGAKEAERLLTARIALLARDDASFQADLTASEAWLKQYFDSRAKPVQAVLASLKQLAATAMPGETPDLTRSLEALRVLRLAQDRAPARGGAATPAR